ncbi:hypothetical protein D3C76_1586740 [compost metagenome]
MATVDTVGNALTQQGFFQHPRLGVGAIEDGNVATGQTGLERAFDGFYHIARFIVFVEGRVQAQRFAIAAIGP